MALSDGAQGDGVRQLQVALAGQGFDVGVADGSFGPATERAVRAFQAANGLGADGIVGPRTWSALGLPGSVPSGSERPPTKPVRID